MRIDTKYHFEIVDELEALKSLVRQFLLETVRSINCDQEKIEELWDKLSYAIEEKTTLDKKNV